MSVTQYYAPSNDSSIDDQDHFYKNDGIDHSGVPRKKLDNPYGRLKRQSRNGQHGVWRYRGMTWTYWVGGTRVMTDRRIYVHSTNWL